MAAPKLADMNLFSIVEDSFVITVEKGVYRQVPLYERFGALYAAHRSGFARLLLSGSTSIPNLKWDAVEGIDLGDQNTQPREGYKATGLMLPRSRQRLIAAE